MNPPRHCKECNIPIPKGKHYCKKHLPQNQWDRPSFTKLECNECHIVKPKHHFSRHSWTCKVCINFKGREDKEYKSTNVISKILGDDAQEVFKRHKQYSWKNRLQKEKIPYHTKQIKSLKREVHKLKKKHEKELRYAEYLVKQKEIHLDKCEKGIENRNIERDVMMDKLVDSIIENLPMNDFDKKDHWTQSITQMEEVISKYSSVPIGVIRKIRQQEYNTKKLWTAHIDVKVKEIQPNYTGTAPWILECLECGDEQKYPTRTALVRALGLDGNNDKKYGGYCELCGQSQPQSDEMKQKARVSHIKNLGFDSWEEYEENIFVMGEYKSYGRVVRHLSNKNLRDYNAVQYKRLKANPYNSTINNYKTGLTIEHLKPVSEGWRKRIPIKEISHTNNLIVITMKENYENWKKYKKKQKETA